jgi:HK97 family phage major capsid protein
MSYELDQAVEVIEKRIDSKFREARADMESVRDLQERFREVEQRVAGGFRGSLGSSMSSDAGAFERTITESEGFKSFMANKSRTAKVPFDGLAFKNTILGEGGSPQAWDGVLVPADRRPGIVGSPTRRLRVMDYLPFTTTTSAMVEYTRELAWDNGAASQQGEGAEKAPSTLTFEILEAPVRTVATWLKTSRQVLNDQPSLQTFLSNRLRDGILREMERQILRGDGLGYDVAGLTNAGNFTAYTPVESEEDRLSVLRRARAQLLAADFLPSAVVMAPADVAELDLERSESGGYLVGQPRGSDAPRLWNVPVIESVSMTPGTFIMGDFPASAVVFDRQQAQVEFFEQDETNVQENLITVRAELRFGLAVTRPQGIVYGSF